MTLLLGRTRVGTRWLPQGFRRYYVGTGDGPPGMVVRCKRCEWEHVADDPPLYAVTLDAVRAHAGEHFRADLAPHV